MRNRVLRKGIWKEPSFIALSHVERLVYLGLHNMADDEGRLIHSPQNTIEALLPEDPGVNVPAILDRLNQVGLVKMYAVNGRVYTYIVGFEETQSISKKQPSRLPAPTEGSVL